MADLKEQEKSCSTSPVQARSSTAGAEWTDSMSPKRVTELVQNVKQQSVTNHSQQFASCISPFVTRSLKEIVNDSDKAFNANNFQQSSSLVDANRNVHMRNHKISHSQHCSPSQRAGRSPFIHNKLREFSLLFTEPELPTPPLPIHRWSPPPPASVKVNVDAAIYSSKSASTLSLMALTALFGPSPLKFQTYPCPS
nr:hypothetical protein CFP56_24974 [Quercus suber]